MDEELQREDTQKFEAKLSELTEGAEKMRVTLMERHQSRSNAATGFSIFSVFALGAAFGWFFFMKLQIVLALGFLPFCAIIPLALFQWAEEPLKAYREKYKSYFMPRLAHLLGGFKFYPKRGIGAKIIQKTDVIPAHKLYRAEDCFMGRYKGVKVLFSEARLYADDDGDNGVFDGVFVLLEGETDAFEGHTVLTTDKAMVKHYAGKRWKSLQSCALSTGSAYDDRFQMYSSAPETVASIVSEKLLKELGEAADIFDEANLTAVFFQKKYIFLMIETAQDMFEPSAVEFPIYMNRHTLQCKQEIDQILEIIDVIDLYKAAPKSAP